MRRPDRADVAFISAAIIAIPILLGLGAGLTFFSDEWAFIESRSLTDPSTWFTPHNEHWSTLPILVYRALVETVGLRSYMPFLAVLIALHLVVSALAYVLVRRASGRWPALAVGCVVLFLGSGFENLYWAFQIGFVGSLAAGLAAILVFDAAPLTGRRAMLGGTLLLAALATTGGPGLACCVAVGVELLLDTRRRRMAVALAIPVGSYLAWYLAVGRAVIESHRGPFTLGGVSEVPPAILSGFGNAADAIVGAGTPLSLVALGIGAAIWIVRSSRSGHFSIPPRAVGCVAGTATFYGLIGLARASIGADLADYSRYTYVSAILLVVGIAPVIGRPSIATPNLRRTWVLVGGTILALSVLWNVRLLVSGRTIFVDRAAMTRALVTAGLQRPLPASTDPDRSLVLVPSPNSLSRLVAAYGSPVTDSLVPWAVAMIPDAVRVEAERRVREGAPIPLPPGAAATP